MVTFIYAMIASAVLSKPASQKRYNDEEEDARMYIQMPDGNVRLD